MRYINLLLVAFILGFSSCSTSYRSGQTPDDVYYSPERAVSSDYVSVESDRNDRYNSDEYYSSDRYLRMKAQRRNRWSTFDDDFFYWNNPTWNNPHYFNSPFVSNWNNPWFGQRNWFSFNQWNSGFINPFLPGFYSAPVVIVNRPVNPRANTPRRGNLSSYNYTPYTVDPKTGGRTYNISSNSGNNTRTRSGGSYYVTPSNRTYQNSNSNSSPSRSFNSNSSSTNSSGPRSSSGSGSSGSSSGGSAPVRSFPRGGN